MLFVIEFLRRKKISTQINVAYGLIFFFTLIFINICTVAGITIVTFDMENIYYILLIVFFADLIGLGLAIMMGNILGRKILKPLGQVTKTAQEISFNQQQRFIADASHELRTPITVIRGYADVLERYGAEDPEILEEATAEIKKSAQNMQYLVENLLFLARADAGTQPLNFAPLEINEVLKSVVASFKNPRIEFNDDESFEITGDAEFLKKMFAAFIDNALIYSDDKIFVTLENFGDTATVKISDSGIGISAENLDKIFDRFFKVDKSRAKTNDDKISAGLGLSIAKVIADSHKIKIHVESEVGRGAVFTLTFQR